MVMIAVAGGAGAFGRTLLDAIAKSGEHDAMVLSRTAGKSNLINNFRCFAVDYKSIAQIKQILQENKVEIVISSLVLIDEDSAKAQINLIRAAAQSGSVTRFIPTEYYINFHKPIPSSDFLANFQLEAEEELLRHPQLTFTLVRNGIFMDHITMPYNSKKIYIASYWVFVDIDHEQCIFPGDGSYPLVFTHSTDVAAYIERLCGLSAKYWPRESIIASNKLQVKDLSTIIRNVTGKDFQLTYDSEEAIRAGRITQLPSNEAVMNDFLHKVEHQVMLSMLSKTHEMSGQNLAELFPEIQPINIEDFFKEGWALKQSSVNT